ncbi:hypothetical protein AB0L63_00425 [Nocardia sp. NPDC051990]|uniref:hypothetical protein n=1 Tax=Nocardia sp. NPDC051990 TaxID=3155285 RepID=UPI00343A0C7A
MIIVAFGALLLLAPTATAAPSGPPATEVGDFSFNAQVSDDAPKRNGTPKKDERADKAEKLGGGVVGKVIDLAGSIAKCVLNIVTPSVKCQL